VDSGGRAERCFLERQGDWPRIRNCNLSLRRDIQAIGATVGAKATAAEHEIRFAGREKTGNRAPAVISGTSAGFGRRVAALVYDAFLLAALLMIFTGGALFFTHGAAVVPATAGAWVYVYRAGLLLVIAGYYALNWLRSGQTLGMRAWRIRTVSASGDPVTWQAAILRIGFGFLAWAPAALGVLWLYLDPQHLALHDRLSKTRVVRLSGS
jgi:uncharacterized RDD family membrane protein YckC